MHLNLNQAVALARFTASTLHIEAEAARFVTSGTCLGYLRKQLSNRCEQAGIGGRV